MLTHLPMRRKYWSNLIGLRKNSNLVTQSLSKPHARRWNMISFKCIHSVRGKQKNLRNMRVNIAE